MMGYITGGRVPEKGVVDRREIRGNTKMRGEGRRRLLPNSNNIKQKQFISIARTRDLITIQ